MIPFVAAWCGHTDVSREMAKSLTAALQRHGIKHETAADVMGLGFEDFSKQVNGLKPLNLWRLGFFSLHQDEDVRAVYVTYLKLEARRFGAELITAEDRALVVGFATAGRKRMARMFPVLFEQERKEA